jgi:glycosyltransferase involved in cell wall biosynthesis
LVIGLDARAAAEVPAGRGRFVRELLRALSGLGHDHRYVLYCRRPWSEAALDDRFEWARVGLPDPLWHAAAAARANRRCDVFLSTNSYLTAWMLRIPTAVVVYDLVAFLPGAEAQARAARIERATIRPAIRRARRLLCISAATESDLRARFPGADGKTAVIHLAADERFGERHGEDALATAARRYGVEPHAYVLAAGTLEPRKNLVRLIRAHAGLAPELRESNPLLIVGPHGWEEDEILATAGEHRAHLRLAGHVPDADLRALYAACSAFCYPSLYEGFGLPVLEAMAAGAPVVTSDVSSLPEVAGDAAAYVDPLDEESIRQVLERVLSSPQERAELSARGRERAGAFGWDRTAEAVAAELERLVR